MPATFYGLPIDAAADLVSILKICTRLNEWTRKPTTSPLISLIQQHVAKLSAQAQTLGNQLNHPAVPTRVQRLDEIAEILQSIKIQLFNTLTLLDFCSTAEKDGDEGALNALFSALLITNDTKVDLAGVRYINDRLHRSRQECYGILSRWFGPEATLRNYMWGTGPKPTIGIFEELM